MKQIKVLNLLFILTIVFLSSCGSDDDFMPPITEIPEILVSASVNGTVVDELGEPMENVVVRVGMNTAQTDAYGVFSFNDIETNKNGTLISINKEGFFNNSKIVFTSADKTSYTKIMLIEKIVTSTFNASSGGTATTSDGAKVVIPAQGVKLESGGSYSGNVNVYATWLDPTADDLGLRMPGDLRAINGDDEAVKLVTYGMIGVELEGDNGEPLNIADGQTATIEIPVPSSLVGSAPSTIPLWHFDEVSGYWIEEGSATLSSNNTYVGTVSHFSFWNYDVPGFLIHIEGLITDTRDNGLGYSRVEVSVNSNGDAGVAYTDHTGFYQGYVPVDELLTIKVFGECQEELYSGQIGPFSADAVLPTIIATSSSNSFLTVTGILNNCNMEIESQGYVLVNNNTQVSVDANGNFNGTVEVCDALEVTISGVSINPFSQGTTTVHDISGLNELNVGTLITCW